MTVAALDHDRVSVKHRLPSTRQGRRRRYVEPAAYGAVVTRMIQAYGRRVGGADVEDLPQLLALHGAIEDALADAARGLRRCGYSWSRIGGAVGITKQAAQQRWGD